MKYNGPMFIWWLDQRAMDAIKGAWLGEDDVTIIFPDEWPVYLKEQWESRYGCLGRGRLWADDMFGNAKVAPWPEGTPMGNYLGGYGGIVIMYDHLELVRELPGVVTDMRLKRV